MFSCIWPEKHSDALWEKTNRKCHKAKLLHLLLHLFIGIFSLPSTPAYTAVSQVNMTTDNHIKELWHSHTESCAAPSRLAGPSSILNNRRTKAISTSVSVLYTDWLFLIGGIDKSFISTVCKRVSQDYYCLTESHRTHKRFHWRKRRETTVLQAPTKKTGVRSECSVYVLGEGFSIMWIIDWNEGKQLGGPQSSADQRLFALMIRASNEWL